MVNADGNRNVPYLNGNADKRNLNLNEESNDWNDNYRFLAFRQFIYFSSSLRVGKFLSRDISDGLHPPSHHLSYFFQRPGERGILFRVDPFQFPKDFQEKF